MGQKVVVIGAGIGGLATAAILSKAGMDVTVLEAQVYPGGCASTFFHKGYRFDAGATLAAGFYPGGPMDKLANAVGISSWPIVFDDPAMVVHLPDKQQVSCISGETRWKEYEDAFGEQSLDFFKWQEKYAKILWKFAIELPSWPIKSLSDLISVITAFNPDLLINSPRLLLDLFQPLQHKLKNYPEKMKLFIDSQLMISAQTTSENANTLYAASALDLPRRGVGHFPNGIGTLAEILVNTIKSHGGKVLYRQQVIKLIPENGKGYLVETKKKDVFQANIVIANLTPWNVAELMEENPPKVIKRLNQFSDQNWGAFMLYLGVNSNLITEKMPLHHQIIKSTPLGEGNSLFVSISPEWDKKRAPIGQRAITVSTHTNLKKWWNLVNMDLSAYENEKLLFTNKIFDGLELIFPGIRRASSLILPGTPITFQRYTGRKLGWVGGFPQTSLFTNFHPQLDKNLYVVGDSIFPGQSTAAVALGGLRVAKNILNKRSIY